MTLSIVIPAFNEADQMPATLAQLAAFLSTRPWTWEIRVVDDGSSDRTSAVTEQASRQDARIVLQREPHRGKGGAVKAGMLAARAECRFLCDADLSMPPSELDRFLPLMEAGADVVIASREGPGARRVNEPWRRHVTGRVFNYAIRALVLDGIADTQCGFKLFTARAAEAIFPHARLTGWAFDVEVLAIARELGLRAVEVPIEWHYRSTSRLSIRRDASRMLRDVLAVRARARRGTLLG